MLPQTPIEEFDAELNRVVIRLRSLPINKIDDVQETFIALTEALLTCSATLGDAVPVALPAIEPRAYADAIAVLAQDVRKAAADENLLVPATLALTHARRALP